MMTLLSKEQKDDDQKKVYCNNEIDQSEDEQKTMDGTISDTRKTIANSKDMSDTLTDDILKIASDIKSLDKAVAEGTQQRKSENSAYVEELASNNAAVEILTLAKNRLNKFYNPKLYRAPPKRELNEADAITVNMGGTLAPTAAPGGIAGTGIVALQDAFSFLQAKYENDRKEESSGVIGLLDTLIKDIKKQVTQMQFEEKDTQAEYEEFMNDSAAKRATDAKALSVKESAKADAEGSLQKHGQELKTALSEALANGEYLQSLHKECDWMLSNFDVRQEARTSEIGSLKQAKAVLSGADYSFLQVQKETKRNLRRVQQH